MILRTLRAGAVAGVVTGIVDAGVTSLSGEALPGGAASLAAVVEVGIHVLAGALAGSVVGVGARGLASLEPIRAGVVRVARGLRHPLAADPVVAAAVPAAIVAVAALGVLDASIVVAFGETFHDASLSAWLLLAVLFVLDLAAIAAGAGLYAAIRAVARRVPALERPAATVWPLAAVSVVVAAWAANASDRLATLPIVPAGLGLGWIASTALLAVRGTWPRRAIGSRGLSIGLAALALCPALLHGRDAAATIAIAERSGLAALLLSNAARATDVDGDGAGTFFGGADCAPWDPDVQPRAVDRPGDGIDQNCTGRDARRTSSTSGSPGFVPPPPALARANVVLVTVDALRRDRLAAYGRRGAATMPALDRFSEGAVVFENAFAQSSRSLRSIPSLWTGRYPSEIAWGEEHLFQGLLPENDTVAEDVLAAGWDTGAWVSTSYFRESAGFFQGFAAVHQDSAFKGSSTRAADGAIAFLAAAPPERRFLVWLHLFDPHDPYTSGRRRGGRAARYDAAVGRADREIGRFLEALDQSAHAERTIVVVAADHGESLGEHGQLTHGRNLYTEVLGVPLLVRGPGIAARRSKALVGLLDVAELVKNLATPSRPRPSSGRSLLPILTGAREAVREKLFAELLPDGEFPTDLKSVTDGRFHLVRDLQSGVELLFDLVRDPGETRDVSREQDRVARRLGRALDDFLESAPLSSNQDRALVERFVVRRLPRRLWAEPESRFGRCAVLEGVGLPRSHFRPGDALPLDLYFRRLASCPDGARVGVTFVPSVRQRIPRLFGGFHTPALGRYPIADWRPGEIVHDPVHLTIPPTLRPTRLEIQVSIGIPGDVLEQATVGTITVEGPS